MKIRLFIPLIFVCTASTLQAQDATKKELLIQTSKALALDARNKFSKAVLAAKIILDLQIQLHLSLLAQINFGLALLPI